MASIGHIAVGMAAARAYSVTRQSRVLTAGTPPRAPLVAVLLWSALSFLPDADVIGFAFGVAYGDEWGHRGASHSFVFAVALGAVIGAAAPFFKRSPIRTALLATLVLASHPLLDIFTDGGLGCALFWPFDLTRYFAPWRPIPVSPIGLGYLSPYGMYVATAELAVFAPLFWMALRRNDSGTSPGARARQLPIVILWLAALLVLFSR